MGKRTDQQRMVSVPRALSKLGFCSRSQAEVLVSERVVTVNGVVVKSASFRVDPAQDRIAVRGVLVRNKKQFVYFLLNKPAGYITTRVDERARQTVYDLFRHEQTDDSGALFPVGRLDKDTTGALLITNDTQLAEYLTNPDSHVPKTYHVVCDGEVNDADVRCLTNGVELDDGYTTRPATLTHVKPGRDRSECSITITEGKNRQIRRMFDAVGHPVIALQRISIGTVKLGRLQEGELRPLTAQEISQLKGR